MSAIDITLQRFAEYHNLQGAFGRRAVIEQAKGILMARHSVDADKAFALLRARRPISGCQCKAVSASLRALTIKWTATRAIGDWVYIV